MPKNKCVQKSECVWTASTLSLNSSHRKGLSLMQVKTNQVNPILRWKMGNLHISFYYNPFENPIAKKLTGVLETYPFLLHSSFNSKEQQSPFKELNWHQTYLKLNCDLLESSTSALFFPLKANCTCKHQPWHTKPFIQCMPGIVGKQRIELYYLNSLVLSCDTYYFRVKNGYRSMKWLTLPIKQ